jgi:hypothetical protein
VPIVAMTKGPVAALQGLPAVIAVVQKPIALGDFLDLVAAIAEKSGGGHGAKLHEYWQGATPFGEPQRS